MSEDEETYAVRMVRRVAEVSELAVTLKKVGFHGGLHCREPGKVYGPPKKAEIYYDPEVLEMARPLHERSQRRAKEFSPAERRRLGFDED